MRIDFIDNEHPLYPKVKKLGRKYGATLGFMPEGGFDDYAMRRSIITASEGDSLLGYLMFRQTSRYGRVAIVHLAVDEQYRGKGVSTELLNTLRNRFKDSGASGIVLNCRKDYKKPSELWARYGFVAKGTRRSRSLEKHYLTTWWYEFPQRDLFTLAYEASTKVKALLDLNVIVKLRDAEKGGDVQLDAKEDPRCLLADWLVEETELCYAPEVFNEINRDEDLARMQETTIFVTGAFMQAVVDAEKMKVVAAELKNILPGKTDNAVSDRKEVASSIVSGIRYFITYDEDVLKKKALIEDRYDLQIYTPQEFLLEIDELLHREEYAPSLLQGVALHTVTRQDATGLKAHIDKFQRNGQHERKTEFENVVMGCLNKGGEMFTVNCQNGELAFYGWSDMQDARVIHFLRVAEGPLGSSLLCQIVTDRLRECVAEKRKQLVMEERYLTEEQRGMLLRLGFMPENGGTFVKHIRSEIVDGTAFDIQSKEEGVRLEMMYYPLKIRDLDIPCYIIPIKAVWAGHLFDHVISSENLFGADPSKLWSFENVYYRHKKPITEEQPARILWYVCDRKERGAHSKMIVASSYLTEVHTGKGQELYRRFKHYGIYEWSDIYALCGGEKDEDIRALKFSHTELFTRPIGFADAREILGHYGYGKWTFQSPLKVPKEAFFEFYERGMV